MQPKSVQKQHAIVPDPPGNLTSACKCFWMLPDPLELSNVLSDSARAFLVAPECTCSYGGAFRMLQDLAYRTVKYWGSWDLSLNLRRTSRSAGTVAQHCGRHPEEPKLLERAEGDFMLYSHSTGFSTTTSHFVLTYSSLLQSQDLLHHKLVCII